MSGIELAIASAVIGAVGSIASARSQAAGFEFQASIQRQQAQREREIAERDADAFRRRQSALLATGRARRAASGVAVTGTPLLVEEDFIEEAALNEALIRAGGAVRATRLEQSALISRRGAGAARTSGLFGAGRTLLTGFGEAFK